MKYLFIAIIGLLLVSCGTRVPYTNQVRDEFGLDSEQMVKKVQFLTSATIILEKNKQSGGQATDDSGVLVSSSSNEQDAVTIPIGTECVFDSFGSNGELVVRFEPGAGKTISFAQRGGSNSGKYYFVADWKNGQNGGTLKYGNEMFLARPSSGTAFLLVKKKKLQKTKRKNRVVKGMKV